MSVPDRTLEGPGGLAPGPSSAELVRGPLAPDELEWVTERLLQAQKLELLGRLAAGVAHDFNNLLTVIIGVADLRAQALGPGDPVRADLEEIRGAGERAAALTRQLLNFSRSSKVEPAVIDAVAQLRSLEKMIRRLIGEDIVMTTRLQAPNPSVFVDPMQFDVVMLNLVINARDAMLGGGKLTIECANISGTSGQWLEIRVQDTGSGMDEETRRRIFQPFFTTKAPGRGTGLGLAACYGIVTATGGTIRVESEPGRGTVFTVGFPSCGRAFSGPGQRAQLQTERRGAGETVLLVEDDPNVRKVCEETLVQQGYRVIPAGSGFEALALADAHTGTIELVVSDVVMNGMSGPALVKKLRMSHEGLRGLFVSGYSDDVLLHDPLGPPDGEVLRKPFAPAVLACRVREALERQQDGRTA